MLAIAASETSADNENRPQPNSLKKVFNKNWTVVLTTNPHLQMGVESTPEMLCERHSRQWILSNKFML